MMTCRVLAVALVAGMLCGCIESNPQPSPQTKKDVAAGDQGSQRMWDAVADLSEADGAAPADVPTEIAPADVPADLLPDLLPDLPPETVEPDTAGPPEQPGMGPARGGILVSMERYVYVEGDTQETARVHARFFEEPVAPFIGLLEHGNQFLHAVDEEGGCVLMAFEPDQCDPICDYDRYCVDGQCLPWAKPISAGDVTVDGLNNGSPVKLQFAYGFYYDNGKLPAALFDAASVIKATATGDSFPGFAAEVAGVDPLETGIEKGFVLTLEDGSDATVTWTAGNPADRVRLVVKSPNACHGCPIFGQLVCDVPDTGSLTVPASLIEKMPAIYPAEICVGHDCPMSYLERRRCAAIDVPDAPAWLCATSRVSFLVDHVEK